MFKSRVHFTRIFVLLTSLLFLLPASTLAEGADGRIKEFMHSFVLEFAKMSPYLASDQAFTSEKGRATVGESLSLLAGQVKNPPPDLQRGPGFRITYSLLAEHVQKTQEIFSRGEMAYARMRVNGIGNLCAACHMQAPKISHFSGFEFVVQRSEETSFENAEFLFVIRRYDQALSSFDKLAREFPKNSVSVDQLNEIYRRKLAIFARVYRDPAAAIANLSLDLKNEHLPPETRRDIRAWTEALKAWQEEKGDPAKLKTPELVAFVEKKLPPNLVANMPSGSPELLTLLRLSGLLYERLYSEPSGANTQAILYYLALCERSLSPLYWYSVSEIYLKECVVQYPKKSFSKKCFAAYREGLEERYQGQPIPGSVRQTIDSLKDYL